MQNFGTASVRGIVVTDDDARAPLRRSTVILTRTGIEDIRMAATDDAGAYSFDRLPAGSYTLSAAKAAFISMSYGAPKAGMPGSSIALVDGQIFAAKPIALMRGAVIAGRLTDPSGRPVIGSVRADQIVTVNGVRQRRSSTGATAASRSNAHGDYRLYGLLPGEYAVSATLSPLSVEGEMSADELAALARGAGPLKPRRAVIPAPTLFPGTADPSAFVAVKVSRAEERTGVDFSVQYLPVARVSGTVAGLDGRPAANAMVLCQFKEPNAVLPPNGVPIGLTTADGLFSCSGLLPGSYRLYGRMTQPVRVDAQAPAGSPAQRAAQAWGWADVTVAGQDISDVAIRVQPGLAVTGRIVLKSADPSIAFDFSRFQIRLTPVNPISPAAPANAAIAADGTFEISGVVPDTYRLSVNTGGLSGAGPWTLRSAVIGDGEKDLADQPFEVTQPMAGLTVTLTDAPAELSGVITDGAGRPGPQLYVFAFPQDKSLWLPNARRVMSARSTDTGAYRLAGLPPGEYYVCALTELDTALQTDPTYLEQLIPASFKITLGEGEKKRQDLAIK
ncbi:MAG TPA: carboxypeptidase-like regulatory domain-containing protein [Vicinamibacterales bacterium]|nr:carboxypeptidase-like regulatory domain-containing protein [Vicinamibacterales bacterium]